MSLKRSASDSIDSNSLVDTGRHLFTSGRFSDITIKCGEQRYKCHKAIICPQSVFFDGCCKPGFKEAEEALIDLVDDDPGAVTRMIQFFYSATYEEGNTSPSEKDLSAWMKAPWDKKCKLPTDDLESDEGSSEEESESEKGDDDSPDEKLYNNLAVYVLAEKYTIPALKELAFKRSIESLNQEVTDLTVVDCLRNHIFKLDEKDPLRRAFIRTSVRSSYREADHSNETRRPLLLKLEESRHFQQLMKENSEICQEIMIMVFDYARTLELNSLNNLGFLKLSERRGGVGAFRGPCGGEDCGRFSKFSLVMGKNKAEDWHFACSQCQERWDPLSANRDRHLYE